MRSNNINEEVKLLIRSLRFQNLFKMAAEPTFKSLCFNSFLAKDYLNDSNQDPDTDFYNGIYSIEATFLLPCETNNKLKHISSETFSIFT